MSEANRAGGVGSMLKRLLRRTLTATPSQAWWLWLSAMAPRSRP